MKSTKVDIVSIKYNDNEQARKDFVNLILDYLIDHQLVEKDDAHEKH
ncbi:hypothetical protein IZY60_10555 [Lutibacter sp. B2]|nr:hypothetical protein [Lutibacter sp. B2]